MKKKTIKIKVRYTDGTEQVLEIPGLQGDSGLSAYEIARQGGFEGTEEEWLASLKGEPYMLTAQDKQEIADAVLAALPTYDGGLRVEMVTVNGTAIDGVTVDGAAVQRIFVKGAVE